MKKKLIPIVVCILLVSSMVEAASQVMLRLRLQKGTTYNMTMLSTNNINQEMMGQKMKIDQTIEMVFSYQVLDVLPNNNFMIEYSVLKIKMDMNMNGQTMNYDSGSPDVSNPVNASLNGLVSSKLKLEVNSKGQVEKVEGLDEYARKLGGNPQVAQSMQMFTNEDYFKSFIGQTFNYFPEKEVAKGEKWTSSFKLPALMNIETKMNFEVADIKTDQIDLNVTSDVDMEMPIEQMGMKMNMKMTGTQTGTVEVDLSDGWVRSSNLAQKFDMNMKMKNPQTGDDMEIPVVSNSVTKVTVVKK